MNRLTQLREARNQSLNKVGSVTLILKSRSRREFFKYVSGELVEYDMSRYKSIPIKLTREEEEVASSFPRGIE